MIEIDCPWCGEGQPFEVREPPTSDADFTCGLCGTSVETVDVPEAAYELAA